MSKHKPDRAKILTGQLASKAFFVGEIAGLRLAGRGGILSNIVLSALSLTAHRRRVRETCRERRSARSSCFEGEDGVSAVRYPGEAERVLYSRPQASTFPGCVVPHLNRQGMSRGIWSGNNISNTL